MPLFLLARQAFLDFGFLLSNLLSLSVEPPPAALRHLHLHRFQLRPLARFQVWLPQSLVILGHFLVESTLLRFQPLFALLRLLDLALQLGQLRLLRFEPELKNFDLQASHFRRQALRQGGEVRDLPGSVIRRSWRGSWPRSLAVGLRPTCYRGYERQTGSRHNQSRSLHVYLSV